MRHRDLLGGEEAAAEQHRAAHVEQQHGGRAGEVLVLVDGQVLGGQPHAAAPWTRCAPLRAVPRRRLTGLAGEGVGQRPAQVQVERPAELVGHRRLRPFAAGAAVTQGMRAEGVALEPREQLVEDALPDAAAAARGQLDPVAADAPGNRPPPAHRSAAGGRPAPAPRRRQAGPAPRPDRSRPGHRDRPRRPSRRPGGRGAAGGPAGRGRPPARGPRRRGRRIAGPAPPGRSRSRVEASCARSHRRRSSRRRASISDWSSARWAAVIDASSDCMAAIRSVSCSMTSSSVRAPGKKHRGAPGSRPRQARRRRAAPGAAG